MSKCWSIKSADADKCRTALKGLKTHRTGDHLIVRSENPDRLLATLKGLDVEATACPEKMTTYLKPLATLTPQEATLAPSVRSWFKASEYAAIYGMPAPSPTRNVVVGVVSFGGGLYGTVNGGGILTSGDCQDYWTYLGISSQPTVKIVGVAGATNDPAGDGTDENTLDVQMIGACCPTNKLTIILYIVPNSLSNFTTIMDYILNTPVDVNGTSVKPGIISISWGAPEIYYSNSLLNAINTRFQTAATAGIPVSAASGDNGSTDGTSSNCCDFPSSSPNLVACGGTRLTCPNYVYDGSTTEVAWSNGGGAVSFYFSKPTYQSALTGTKRRTPDIAMNADPATGTLFLVNGQYVVYGGTSVVAPALSGYFAAIGCNKFPNTTLYANSGTAYFHDIVSGSNGGFNAGPGYDNCTGLGSIKGAQLAGLLGSVPVSGVSVSAPQTTVNVGSTVQLTATVSPSNATNKTVSWSTSNASVATVSSSGLVSGVATGSATITATTQDGGYTATTTMTVVANNAPSKITLSRYSVLFRVGSTIQLTATVSPSTASKTITWTTSNAAVATVSSTGLVRAVGRGKADIKAASASAPAIFATCSVNVN